ILKCNNKPRCPGSAPRYSLWLTQLGGVRLRSAALRMLKVTLRSPRASWSGSEPLPSDRNDFYSSVDTRVERSLLGEVQNDVEIVCRVAGLGRRKRGAGGILGEGFDQGHDRDPPFPVWASSLA